MIQLTYAPLLLVAAVNAATFTIFDVLPSGDNPTGTEQAFPGASFRALGVGTDGATTYDLAITDQPEETDHAVVVADATRFHLSAATPFPLDMDCTWKDTNGDGVCSFFDEGLSSTVVITGPVVAVYTLTADDASGGPTPTTGTASLPSGQPSAGDGSPGTNVGGSGAPEASQSNAATGDNDRILLIGALAGAWVHYLFAL